MPFTVRADETHRVVIVDITGTVDAADTRAMIAEARAIAGPRQFNILYDVRTATPGKIDNTDVFWISRKTPQLAEPAQRRLRVAVLHVAAQRAFVEFWETAYNNVGIPARGFEDEEAAYRWLAGP